MPQGNPENLRVLTTEEAREIGSKGGKASVKARRKKKELRELLEIALSQPYKDNPDDDNYMAIAVALVQRALDGDTKAFEIIRDTLGQKPKDQIEVETQGAINIVIDENN